MKQVLRMCLQCLLPALIASGCASARSGVLPLVYPGAVFSGEERTFHDQSLEYTASVQKAYDARNVSQKDRLDPFASLVATNCIRRVLFFSSHTPDKVKEYYCDVLPKNGWIVERERIRTDPLRDDNALMRVYRRDSHLMHITVGDRSRGATPDTMICLQFLEPDHPRDFLGEGYRGKSGVPGQAEMSLDEMVNRLERAGTRFKLVRSSDSKRFTLSLGALEWKKDALSDISFVKGMPVSELWLRNTQVKDLSPLKGMQLNVLSLRFTPVEDLSPLKGMDIKGHLDIGDTKVNDLSPLKGMSLASLVMDGTAVSDFSFLKVLPQLQALIVGRTRFKDLDLLKGRNLKFLNINQTRTADLSPLQGMPLEALECADTPVTDLSPLRGMNLRQICFSPARATNGIDVIRNMTSLTEIGWMSLGGYMPAEKFWKKYDAGEFRAEDAKPPPESNPPR